MGQYDLVFGVFEGTGLSQKAWFWYEFWSGTRPGNGKGLVQKAFESYCWGLWVYHIMYSRRIDEST